MSINAIKFIYNTNLSTSGNATAVPASVVVFFFVCIIGYLCYTMILKDISYDWDNKRCTPRYIFYSGFLKSTTGDPFKDTYNNFVDCTNPMNIKDGKENKLTKQQIQL